MTDQPPHSADALGGNSLLLTVSAATIVTVALISAFLALGTWLLLPVIMVVLLLMTAGVVGSLGRLIGAEDADAVGLD